MAAEIFKVLSNLRIVLDSETDADSPDNETTYPAIRQMIEMLFTLCFGESVGSLTSDPPDDNTGWAIDTGAGFTDDEHNGRTILFTSGDGKGLFYTIDDTEAGNNRVECAGDNLYSDGIRSGDDYVILYDIKTNSDGHDHDGINSKSAILADASIVKGKLKTGTGSQSGSTINGTIDIDMQDYCFSPNIYVDDGTRTMYAYKDTVHADYVGRFTLYTATGSTYIVRWRYGTSSDKPFVYAIQNSVTGEIVHVWECDDPPYEYWGLSDKPDDFKPTIRLHYDNKKDGPKNHQEIVLFNYPVEGLKELRGKADKDKKSIHKLLNDDFEYNQSNNLFIRKNLAHI